jgi:prefoldin subunit 5
MNSEKSAIKQQHANELESLQSQLSELNQQLEEWQNTTKDLETQLSSEAEIQSRLLVYLI